MKNPSESGCSYLYLCKGNINNCSVINNYVNQVETNLNDTGADGYFLLLGRFKRDANDFIDDQSAKTTSECSDCIAKQKIAPLKEKYKERLKKITSR